MYKSKGMFSGALGAHAPSYFTKGAGLHWVTLIIPQILPKFSKRLSEDMLGIDYVSLTEGVCVDFKCLMSQVI